MAQEQDKNTLSGNSLENYPVLFEDIARLLTKARQQTVRAVNAIMTTTYWQIGRHIVEFEQGGKGRAEYGEQLLERLAADLTVRFGRGFGLAQIKTMRQFYTLYDLSQIRQSLIGESAQHQNASSISEQVTDFLLSWTHYVRLLRVADEKARDFYESEALRGGWSVRQLDRQIQSQFYERYLLSRHKAAML